MQIAFPYAFENRVTGTAAERDHLRHMLELLLFTIPGERVNRPDFGCAIQRMVFAPQSTEVVATLQRLIESEIQRWLGDVLLLRNIEVSSDDGTLYVLIEYKPATRDAIVAERFEWRG